MTATGDSYPLPQHTIFVYGTLKRGFSNNRLLERAEFRDTGKTKEKFALYASGIPFVIKSEARSHILGEVYLVSDKVLRDLDRLEGHPDWYCREQTQILLDKSGEEISAWLYFSPQPTGELIEDGCYRSR